MARQNMQWSLRACGSTDNLEYIDRPVPAELGADDVLVEMRAASLNSRDITIAKGSMPFTQAKPNTVQGSDGAGVVKCVGSTVITFKHGDKVLIHLLPGVPDDFSPKDEALRGGLGMEANGTLCELGVFSQHDLVRMPENMTFEQAATLPCSGLTAWNALMGLRGCKVKSGDYVLVQGTGGVSIIALQVGFDSSTNYRPMLTMGKFAVAVGATVVATTGKESNVQRLKSLGASHVINHRTDPNWGEVSRSFTPGSRGFDHIVDVGGNATLGQSLNAARVDGIISMVAVLGSKADKVDMLAVLWSSCIVRGVNLGSKAMLKDMVQFCEHKNIHPALDDVAVTLQEAKGAYERLEKQQHFSKVSIKIS